MVFGVFVLRRWTRLRRIVAGSQPCERAELMAMVEGLRTRLGIARPVGLKYLPASAESLGPCAAGWRRPQILLPARIAEAWEMPMIEPILIHELAHIRRADIAVNALQVLLQVIYWFHPLVWLANARLRRERELICDDVAVLHSGATSQRYGATILRAIEEVRLEPAWSLAGIGMGESGLAERLRRLLDRGYALPRPVSRVLMLSLFAAGAMGVLVAGETSSKKDAPATPAAPVEPADAPPPEPQVVAPPPGLLAAMRKRMNPDDPRALAMEEGPKGEFSGKVVDRYGNPVAGVLVDAWDWCPGDETHTAADGTFRLTKLDIDKRIEVRFIKEGYAPYTVIKQPLGALKEPLVLDDETWFEGLVTGPDGKPVAGAFIRANQGPQQADGVFIETIWTETHSDAEGRYKLRVQSDSYEIEATAPGGLVVRLPRREIGVKVAVKLDLRLEPGVVFHAHFVDSITGTPIAGIRLKDWQHPSMTGVSDAQGNLEIGGLIPGEFEFQVEGKEYARWWSEECSKDWDRRKIEDSGWQRNFDDLHYELTRDMKPVTITMEKAVRIRGRIVDPESHPVAGATAAPAHTGTGNSLTGDTRFSVKTKPDGTFEMLLPASGECDYNLVAHDGGYEQWRHWANGVADPFRTKPGQVIDNVELRLNKPAIVRGRVVDEDGKPVPDREVRAQAADRLENRYYDPTVRTDKDGRFELKFIRPGKHLVQVAPFWLRATEAPDRASREVELAEGQILESPDLIAPPQER
jgi:protocatechuate 3,4-dioxygenase beta subunit